MKKIVKSILGCVCVASILLAGSENPDGSINLVWTLSWIAAAVLSGYLWNKVKVAKWA